MDASIYGILLLLASGVVSGQDAANTTEGSSETTDSLVVPDLPVIDPPVDQPEDEIGDNYEDPFGPPDNSTGEPWSDEDVDDGWPYDDTSDAEKGGNGIPADGYNGYKPQTIDEHYESHYSKDVKYVATDDDATNEDTEYGSDPADNSAPGSAYAAARCASGYILYRGDVPGWGNVGRSSFYGVRSTTECGRRCDYTKGCCSYEWSPTARRCNLNSQCKPTARQYSNYVFCGQGFAQSVKRFILTEVKSGSTSSKKYKITNYMSRYWRTTKYWLAVTTDLTKFYPRSDPSHLYSSNALFRLRYMGHIFTMHAFSKSVSCRTHRFRNSKLDCGSTKRNYTPLRNYYNQCTVFMDKSGYGPQIYQNGVGMCWKSQNCRTWIMYAYCL